MFFDNAATFPALGDAVYDSMKHFKAMPEFLKGTDRVPTIQPGVYTLWVTVGRYDGTPQVALLLGDGDGARRYLVGKIELVR